ncbi:enoyl-CoA hydratase-related protein [Acrocarpospora sp. B8E8]|uniref:enoyl-CoA hydratase-related protein n=1 Tax=Acrocarpospora sp. B8E8 TaxID=3153572 RepID=UPI00325EBEC0
MSKIGWENPAPTDGPSLDQLKEQLKVTRYDVAGTGVATVWLHRPDRRNSWTARMNFEYRAVMRALDADPAVRVVVVTGSGGTFSVGADSRALTGYVGAESYDPGLPQDAALPGHGVRDEFDADLVWQYGLRVPVIAAVNGACAGVALALAAFCDLRFAVSGAKVTVASPRLGLPSEYGLSWILPRLIGVTHAADLLLSGRVADSDSLARMGFFNAVYPEEEFQEAVYRYAGQLAAASPLAVTTAKRQLYTDLLHHDPAGSVRQSKTLTGRLMKAPDYKEGVAALVEKRTPRFGPWEG